MDNVNNKKLEKCWQCELLCEIYGNGLCEICYQEWDDRTKNHCIDCGYEGELDDLGRCGECEDEFLLRN